MDETPAQAFQPTDDFCKVESIFVRHRNCLLLQANFEPLFVDYFLHQAQHDLTPSVEQSELFRSFLAYFTLHLVSRPWAEYHAWTLNLRDPMLANLFASGSSMTEDVVGRIFTEGVKEPAQNMLYAQNVLRGREPQNSVIALHGGTVEEWVEDFYLHSEQRQARALYLGGDNFALITAEPGADSDWLDALDAPYVQAMLEGNTPDETKLLETRRFTFRCGCTFEKIMPMLRAMSHELAEQLAEKGQVEVGCPRCSANFVVTAEMLADTESES